MLSNFLRPWILARLLSGFAAFALTGYGALVAMRMLRHFAVGKTSEGQLALERRAELSAAVVQTALAVAILNVPLTVLMADRLTHELDGAMCGYGVFSTSVWGPLSLIGSLSVAMACGLWVALHRLDLRLAAPVLTRRKFTLLLGLAPLMALDLGFHVAFTWNLDLAAVASCCALGLDAGAGATDYGAAGPRDVTAALALVLALGAAGLSYAMSRSPRRITAIALSVVSIAAALAAIPAILWYVAPHAYETPLHHCPFCLLHAEVGGIGWPLFAALFTATTVGLGAGVIEAHRRLSDDPSAIDAALRSLGRAATWGWLLSVLSALVPVARWLWLTGGANLFG